MKFPRRRFLQLVALSAVLPAISQIARALDTVSNETGALAGGLCRRRAR